MMTALELLQSFGLVLVALLARGLLVVGVILVLSIPLVASAYAARAVAGLRGRHHGLAHAHHRA